MGSGKGSGRDRVDLSKHGAVDLKSSKRAIISIASMQLLLFCLMHVKLIT
jgi:hypothetical protein